MAGGPANGWAGGILSSVATEVPINRTAAMPIGVIGLVRPCAKLKQNSTRKPGRWVRATGYKVVMGRACVSQKRPAESSAHSVSCGAP